MIRIVMTGLLMVAFSSGTALAAEGNYPKKLEKAWADWNQTKGYWEKLPQPPSDPKVADWTAALIIDQLVMETFYAGEKADEVAALRERMGKDFGSWPVETRLKVLDALFKKLHSDKYREFLESHYASALLHAGVDGKYAGFRHTLPHAMKARGAHFCYRLAYPDGKLPSSVTGGVDVKDGGLHKYWGAVRKLKKDHPDHEESLKQCMVIRDRDGALEEWKRKLGEELEAARNYKKQKRIELNGPWSTQWAIGRGKALTGLITQSDFTNEMAQKAFDELEEIQKYVIEWREQRAKEFRVPKHLGKMSKYRKAFKATLKRDFPANVIDQFTPYLKEKIVGINIPVDFTYSGLGNVNRQVDAWVVVKPSKKTKEIDKWTKKHGWCVAILSRFEQQREGGNKWTAPKFTTTSTAVQFECKNYRK